MQMATETESEPIDAIVLYNSVDRKEVEEVYRELKRRGLNLWMDTQNMPPGKEYHVEFEKAVKLARSAAAFYGKSGVGKWERKEIHVAVQEFIGDAGRTIIPVFLPGAKCAGADRDGDKPGMEHIESIFVKLHKDVELECKWGVGDPEAYDVLEWGITGKDPREDRGVYQIQVKVPKAEKTCFVAFPPNAPDEVYDIICQALGDVGIERSALSAPSEMATPVEVTEAIRSSELVIGVCSPDPVSNRPAPCTMFLLGQAMALGKPILRVTSDASSVPTVVADTPMVEYSEKDLQDGESLRQTLVETMQDVIGRLRHPFLVEPDRRDISVAYADMLRIPVPAWDRFEAVLSFGLDVDRRFREVGKHVHKLQRDIDECYESAIDIANPPVIDRNWRVFRKAHRNYMSAELPLREHFLREDGSAAHARVPEAFDFLRDHTCDPLQSIARNAREYFDLLLKAIGVYFEHFQRFGTLVDGANPSCQQDVADLCMLINQLASDTKTIDTQAQAMMANLLRFLGK